MSENNYMLNEWKIEFFVDDFYSCRINLVNHVTGEIRQIPLDVNQLNLIWELQYKFKDELKLDKELIDLIESKR